MDKKRQFNQIVNEISSLKIQGAENVARASLKALLLQNDSCSVKKLINLRPTEPCLRNCIQNALFFSDIKKGVKETLDLMNDAKRKIIEIGSNKIQNNSTIFVHCHSSTVVDILINAKKQGKKFQVFNTETRPNFQGRITSKDLAKAKIPVTQFIDIASIGAIKKSDLFLFGADAITSEGNVINKIGNKMLAIIANKYDVPCYCCSFSWKYDPRTKLGFIEKLESRNPKEVWNNIPKGVKINNIIFEEVEADLINGIISELGIKSPTSFYQAIHSYYPKLF